MPYRAPVADIRFLLEHVVGFDAVLAAREGGDLDAETVAAVLTEAGQLCDEVLAPLQRAGDLHPARLENGVVRTSPGFAEGYRAIAEGGWIGIAADPEFGGMGLPRTLATAVHDMMSGACLALQLKPLLSQGQIVALEAHASDAVKALYLPKLASGEWSGTMNLTEPQAGSDVGALRARAEPNGDGTYAISGQKIYISWGDSDITGNVCHLVLARLPDAPDGTRGISLFLVPKLLPDPDGAPGTPNGLRVVSLEHKMGLHGSPTAVMEYDRATGWMIGPEGGGMAAMFTMMNDARLNVGAQGIGVAEGACQHALAFAQERRQGATGGPTGTIVEHPDVRRMLATMRAQVDAARAIALACAVALDMAELTGDPAWAARAAFLTPIAKAFGTDTGTEVADQGIQVHGGMGFVEETGAAQYLRDVRVTAIYEGTNGIQAADLVTRKLKDGGEAATALLDAVGAGAEAARTALPDLARAVWEAAENLRDATDWMLAQDRPGDRLAGSVPYLRAWGYVLGAHFHLRAALVEGGTGPRSQRARVFVTRLLPRHAARLAEASAGSADLDAFEMAAPGA